MVNTNDYVKFTISEDEAVGRVISINEEDSIASIELPSTQTVLQSFDNLEIISEEDYTSVGHNLIEKLIEKFNYDLGEAEMSAELEAKINELSASNDSLTQELTAMKDKYKEKEEEMKEAMDEKAKMEKEKEEMAKKSEALELELEAINKSRLGESRFNEIREISSLASENFDSESLSEMSDGEFANIKIMAQAMKKATEETQTTQKKATEETQTSKTKSTDASESFEEAREEEDSEAAAEVFAASTVKNNKDFHEAMAKLVSRSV